MNGRATLLSLAALAGAIAIPLGLAAQDAPPKPATPQRTLPLAKDLTANITARLVGAKISETRGQFLVAKFVSAGKAAREFTVGFPAHSHTTHERTLMNVIESCTKWPKGASRYEWQGTRARATFSLPKGTAGRITDFREWFLVSLELQEPK